MTELQIEPFSPAADTLVFEQESGIGTDRLRAGKPQVRVWSCPVNRITIDPEQCGGRPCIRGMRIRVVDVLDLLANGLPPGQIIQELPDLQIEDIAVCLRFASRMLSGSPAGTPATPFRGPSWRRHSRGRWRW